MNKLVHEEEAWILHMLYYTIHIIMPFLSVYDSLRVPYVHDYQNFTLHKNSITPQDIELYLHSGWLLDILPKRYVRGNVHRDVIEICYKINNRYV